MKQNLKRYVLLLFLAQSFWQIIHADESKLKYEVISDSEVAVFAANQDIDGSVTIPSSVELDGKQYIVSEISASAFFRCIKITSVYIPNTITKIGREAFYYDESLEKIEVEDGNPVFKNIGLAVVDNMDFIVAYPGKGETNLVIPSSIKGLRETAFEGCQSLKSILIPQSVVSVGPMSFTFCLNLKKVIWEASASTVPSSCFLGCSSLEEVSFSKDVEEIADMAFYSVPLQSITLKSQEPPTISLSDSSPSFDPSIIETATVCVPVGCKDTYVKDSQWGCFTNIMESDSTSKVIRFLHVVELDGTVTEYALNKDTKVNIESSLLLITSGGLSVNYELSKVARIVYVKKPVTDDIKVIAVKDNNKEYNYIDIEQIPENAVVIVYTLEGKQVFSQTNRSIHPISSLIQKLKAGMYLIKVNDVVFKYLKR
ncbi:MAG: leucine-rich repeat domain-containing protein [Prevotella sp.]|nr:leucine-rich repeat domain-containing protein [Prevotella sp.]